MAHALADTIKRLRTTHEMTQAQLASDLGVSRPTYMQIERGKRELTVNEAQTLASVFSMSLEDLLAGGAQNERLELPKESTSGRKREAKPDVRVSVPQQNVKKFTEALLYILEKVGARPNIGETALYKLLYFIDFDYYEKYEEQLIGAKYIKNHYGPTPVAFKGIVERMESKGDIERVKSAYFQYEQKKYLPRRAPDLTVLSGREKAHIDDVLNRLAGKSATELSEYSHGDVPWKAHKSGEVIDYETVFYRDDAYSVRETDDEL